MKVSIVTMNSSYNYGAALQAYALQQKIKSLDIDCDFIDQRRVLRQKPVISKTIKGLLSLPTYLLHKNELEKGYRAFEDFVNEYQTLTRINYSDYSQLEKNPPDSDAFITGSDQVFNTKSCRPVNFLHFVPKDKKKISYAASMGINYIDEDKKEIVREYLKDFSDISVREEDAVNVLKEVCDKDIQVNIDPVFLLDADEWRKIQTNDIDAEEPYILCYILFRTPWLNSKLKEIHKLTKKKIVVVDLKLYRNIYKNKMVRSAGPREFLELLDKADGVVTSSFHGTALSVIYHKKFYSIVNPDSPSRIQNLLTKLGLESRIINENSVVNFQENIDYSHVDIVIKDEQEKTLNYLLKTLR